MRLAKHFLVLSLVSSILVVAPVQNQAIAEDVPLVDGKLWTESTQAEKKAFLVGISNLLNVEYAYQVRGINPPSNEQSIVPRLYEKIDDVTLDQAIRRVDQWYAKNPDKMNKPTLSVIWIDMVEPNL